MRKRYAPPELRRLELEQLTAEERAWISEQRAKLKNESPGVDRVDVFRARNGEPGY